MSAERKTWAYILKEKENFLESKNVEMIHLSNIKAVGYKSYRWLIISNPHRQELKEELEYQRRQRSRTLKELELGTKWHLP